MALNRSAAKQAILLRALQVIERHLADPDLSPAMVAQQAGISLRYLQQLFEAIGESVTQAIRRRRLERCHSDLRDPQHGADSITDISFRWGFNDAAYFSRIFKDVYGMSPSAHRRSQGARTERLVA